MAVPSLIYYRKYRVRKGGEVGTEKGFVPFDFEGGINRVRKATGSSYDSFSTIHLSRIRTKYSRIRSDRWKLHTRTINGEDEARISFPQGLRSSDRSTGLAHPGYPSSNRS